MNLMNFLNLLLLTNDYNYSFNEDDLKYMDNPLVNECKFRLYILLLKDDEESYDDFMEIYNILNDEQKEYIKNDYLNIIKEQEKNKVKIKER